MKFIMIKLKKKKRSIRNRRVVSAEQFSSDHPDFKLTRIRVILVTFSRTLAPTFILFFFNQSCVSSLLFFTRSNTLLPTLLLLFAPSVV